MRHHPVNQQRRTPPAARPPHTAATHDGLRAAQGHHVTPTIHNNDTESPGASGAGAMPSTTTSTTSIAASAPTSPEHAVHTIAHAPLAAVHVALPAEHSTVTDVHAAPTAEHAPVAADHAALPPVPRPLLPEGAKPQRSPKAQTATPMGALLPAAEAAIAPASALAPAPAPEPRESGESPLKANRPQDAAVAAPAPASCISVASASDSGLSTSSDSGSESDLASWQAPGLGFKNCGTTCYAAAMLQVRLARCQIARRMLYRRQALCHAEVALLGILHGAEDISALEPALAPWKLFEQSDPTEFWTALVTAVTKSSESVAKWAEGPVLTQSVSWSPGSCRHVFVGTAVPEQFLGLPLLRGSGACRVSAMFSALISRTCLEGKCEDCHRGRSATERNTLPDVERVMRLRPVLACGAAPPRDLFLTVKRFESGIDAPVRIDRNVHADPLEVTFERVIDPGSWHADSDDDGDGEPAVSTPAPMTVKYFATAFVDHIGQAADTGHYTAAVLEGDGNWYAYNDACVERIPPPVALSRGGSPRTYVIRYSKAD